jgi:hypothetical protein
MQVSLTYAPEYQSVTIDEVRLACAALGVSLENDRIVNTKIGEMVDSATYGVALGRRLTKGGTTIGRLNFL